MCNKPETERVVLDSGCEIIIDDRLNSRHNPQINNLHDIPNVKLDLLRSILSSIENQLIDVDSLIIIFRDKDGKRTLAQAEAETDDFASAAAMCQHVFSRKMDEYFFEI